MADTTQALERVTTAEVPPLAALAAEDTEVRLNAALALAYNGEPAEQQAAIPVLVGALGHHSRVVRLVHVAGALVHLGQVAAPALREALEAGDVDARTLVGAAYTLIRIDPEGAAPAVDVLARLVRHGDGHGDAPGYAHGAGRGGGLQPEEVRSDAIGAVADLGPRAAAALPAVVAVLEDETAPASLRCTAAVALGAFSGVEGLEAVVAALVAALGSTVQVDSGWQARCPLSHWAAQSLERLGPGAAAAGPALVAVLGDVTQAADLRVLAAHALGAIAAPPSGSPPAPPTAAASGMAAGGGDEAGREGAEPASTAVRVLASALGDRNWWVRVNAARALARVGEPAAAAVPALIQALEDKNENVRRQVMLALARMGPPAAPAVGALAERLTAGDLPGLAAETLAKIGDAAVPALAAALEAPTPLNRYAAYGLHKLGTPAAQRALAAVTASAGGPIEPIVPTHAEFFLIVARTPIEPAARREFEALYEATLARGAGSIVEYTLATPKHEFLRYLVQERELMLHGSNRRDIDVLRPVRQSTDSGRHGNQNAVYADPDWLRPMYFAIVDRQRVSGLSNGFSDLRDGGVVTGRYYHFSISAEALIQEPWTDGMIYVLPREPFESQGEWIARQPVRPVLSISVQPEDFPFLEEIQGIDGRLGNTWVRPNGEFPWLAAASRFSVHRRRPAANAG